MSKDEVMQAGLLTAKVIELAERNHLGELERIFVVPAQRQLSVTLRFIVFVGLAPASIGLSILCFFLFQANFFVVWTYACFFLFEAGMLTFFIALKFTLPHYKRLRKEQIAFFEQGLVYFDFRKNVLRATHWEQVEMLDITMQQRRQHIISISIKKTHEHLSVSIINLPQHEEIIRHIEEAYLASCLPWALQEYEQGGVFDFGICEISQQGIKQSWYTGEYDPQLEREELLPWNEVIAIKLSTHFLTISASRADGEDNVWLRAKLGDGFNIILLKGLLARMYPALNLDA